MDASEVKTSYGTLRGTSADGIDTFKGIPFAQARRFAPPERPQAWDGVRDATSYGPSCPQGGGTRGQQRQGMFGGLFGPGETGMDEDCLSLNVFTPGCDDASRPVMVWIHGGAFAMGTGASPSYDGSHLARNGDVVVVTINYRLGVLGFLHLPELGATNLGLRDQIAALQWVRDEIARFGGDPGNVTIFGESAGGKSVECLLASPLTDGLFRRAIAQSTYSMPMDADAGAERARAIAAELGCADDLERLRDLDVDDVLAAAQRVQIAAMAQGAGRGGGMIGGGSGPVIDGEVLPEHPLDLLAGGAARGVQTILGTTLDESRLFGALAPSAEMDEDALVGRLKGLLPNADDETAKRAADVYRRSLEARGAAAGPIDVQMAASTDRMFRQHSIRAAATQAEVQADTWMYLFTWQAQAMEGRLGACHAIEIPFVFGTLDGPLGMLAGDTPQARELAAKTQAAWLSFARTGIPAADELPDWPRYEPGQRRTMVLGTTCEVQDDPLRDERELWASLGEWR